MSEYSDKLGIIWYAISSFKSRNKYYFKSYKEATAKMMLRYALKFSDFHEDKKTILIKLYGHMCVFAVFHVYANIKSCNFSKKKSFTKIVTEKSPKIFDWNRRRRNLFVNLLFYKPWRHLL